jgi:O-antigen chain-terminating methyltransferase
MSADSERIEELTEIVRTVRERVRARYPQPEDGSHAPENGPAIRIPVADLLPIVRARDAAQAKIAAIGSVNPRAGGIVNSAIQLVKKTVARSLQWFVRDQVTFNRETVAALEGVLEALNDQNRAMVTLASHINEQVGGLKAEAVELKDVRRHWIEWRTDWERKLATNEIQFLRSAADLQGAFQHRVTLIESNFRETVRSQHADYLGALDRATLGIQKRLWDDLEKIRMDYERLIHNELRIVRQRAAVMNVAPASPPVPAASAPSETDFDSGRFAERFRGSEDYVRRHQEFYKPFFAGCSNVLDIGCGRGEFLDTMRELAVPARGIDLGEEPVAHCRHKGLATELADLFEYLPAQPDAEFDGIMSSQVVEHLAPEKLPALVRLCAAKLRRGGVLAIETPNPECLAIFATHFFLDPTHTRPVPHQLLAFYMEEAGVGMIEVHRLSPAVESMPEIAELPEHFRERFFGGLDYAIVGRKL